MKLRVDRKNDALYLRLNESAIVDSEEVQPGIILDFDAEGWVVGIEILQLSKRMPVEKPEELEAQIRLMAALKMFELGKLSVGKAAELAGLSKVEFLEMCGRYKVPVFNYSPEELEAELQVDLEDFIGNRDFVV